MAQNRLLYRCQIELNARINVQGCFYSGEWRSSGIGKVVINVSGDGENIHAIVDLWTLNLNRDAKLKFLCRQWGDNLSRVETEDMGLGAVLRARQLRLLRRILSSKEKYIESKMANQELNICDGRKEPESREGFLRPLSSL